jgi:hypothetical protein
VVVYLPKVFTNFVPVFFGLGAIILVKFPEGVLTFQARQFQLVGAGLRERNPRAFDRLRFASLIYAVAFVVLIFAVHNLWWLWLAITFFGFNVIFGTLIRTHQRYEKREGALASLAVGGAQGLVPALATRTDEMAPH